jgi:signal transduction histidine kinase
MGERLDPDTDLDFRLLFESAPGLCLVLRPDLTVAAVTDAYLAATATERAAILGRRISELFPDEPDEAGATCAADLRASLERVVARRRPDAIVLRSYPVRCLESEGAKLRDRRWSSVNTPLLDARGELSYVVHRVEDVTESERRDEQRHRQAQKLDAVGRLAGRVAHELNNLLAVVLSYAELASAGLTSDDPLRADLEEIQRAGQRAADVTRQMLAFSRQQALEATVDRSAPAEDS